MNLVIILRRLTLRLAIFVSYLGIGLGLKRFFAKEKSRPFECGFNPKFNSRLPFSIRFFLVALIFLIFDVEIVLLFPFILSLTENFYFTSKIVFFFLLLLRLGLAHEWNQGRLDWVI